MNKSLLDSKQERLLKKLFKEKLGVFLKQKRLKAGLSQDAIAKAIGLQSAQFISNIERGLCSVPGYILKSMVDEYDINRAEFIKYISNLEVEYYRNWVFNKPIKKKGKNTA